MNFLRRIYLGDPAKAEKNGVIWNMVGSLMYSLQSAILLLVVTRTTGLTDGGIFTICYIVTQMFTTVGSYSMRSFQVSDAKKEYSFSTYFTSRIVSVSVMIICCFGYSLYQGYSGEKMLIIICLLFYRVIEDVEDIFNGEMQRSLRFDVASRVEAYRLIATTVVFAVAYVISKDLIVSSVALAVTALIFMLMGLLTASSEFEEMGLKITGDKLIKLLWTCLPLMIGGFLYNYLVNAAKYAIDRNLGDDIQSIFNILFMPIFAINMFSMFVYKPLIAKMGIMWKDHDKKGLIKIVFKMCMVILGITVFLGICGFVAGCPVLGFIYGVDLAGYRNFFTLLIAFGGFAAFVAFFVVALTVVRRQGYVIISYAMGAATDFLLADRIVQAYGLTGAGILYGLGMLVTLVLLVIGFLVFAGKKE